MKNSWLAVFLILVMMPISSIFAQEQNECNPEVDYLTQGLSALDQEEYESAIQAFTCSIELNQEPIQGLLYRAAAYRESADYDSALADIDRVLVSEPDNILAYSAQGSVFFQQGNYQQAITAYNTAIDLNEKSGEYDVAQPRFFANLAASYAYSGAYDEALDNFNRAISLDPALGLAYAGRGFVQDSLGNRDLAVADWDKSKELDPSVFSYYLERGIYLYDLGYYEMALVMYSQGIQLSPDNALARAYWARGLAHTKLEEYELAISDFDQALELEPDTAQVSNDRGLAYAGQKHYEQAIQDFTRAIDLDPTLYEAFMNRGSIYLAQGQIELANADFAVYFANTGADVAEQNLIQGNAYFEIGEYEAAKAHFIGALLFDPESAEAYLGLGNTAYAQEDFVTALEAYKRYVKLVGEEADLIILDRINDITE